MQMRSTALWDSILLNNKNYGDIQLATLQLQAEKEQLQKEKTSINLLLSYGLNQSGNSLRQVYNNPNDQQRFNIGFTVPIIEMGKRKNQVAQNKLKTEQLQLQLKLLLSNLQVEVAITLQKLPQLKVDLANYTLLDSLATIRYLQQNKLLQNGKVLPLIVQQAAWERDAYFQNKLLAIKTYLLTLYQLQKLCNCHLVAY